MHFVRIIVLFSTILAANSSFGQITGIKIAGDTCNSLTLDLQVLGTSSSPYFFWNFGDPASGTNDTITITGTSPSPYPTHTFSGPGVYTVCVSLQEPGNPVTTVCRTISVGLCCNGVIKSLDSCLNRGTSFSIQTSATITTALWNFGDPASGASNTSSVVSPTHVFSSTGAYTVTAFVAASCDTFTISYPITIISCGSSCTGVIGMRDSCFQNGTTFSLASSASILSQIWSFGDPSSGIANSSTSSTPTHNFSAPGVYTVSVTATASCGVFTAFYTATIVNCPVNCQANILLNDSCSGGNSTFRISANDIVNSVAWNFGDPASGAANTSNSISANHKFEQPGSYNVTAVVNLACGIRNVSANITIINCIKELESCSTILPTGFTPNGDGQNDIFYVRSEDLAAVTTFRIYNRWGQLLFERNGGTPNDESIGWDGKYQGQICAPDIYMYYLEGKCTSGKNFFAKGDLMIIR